MKFGVRDLLALTGVVCLYCVGASLATFEIALKIWIDPLLGALVFALLILIPYRWISQAKESVGDPLFETHMLGPWLPHIAVAFLFALLSLVDWWMDASFIRWPTLGIFLGLHSLLRMSTRLVFCNEGVRIGSAVLRWQDCAFQIEENGDFHCRQKTLPHNDTPLRRSLKVALPIGAVEPVQQILADKQGPSVEMTTDYTDGADKNNL